MTVAHLERAKMVHMERFANTAEILDLGMVDAKADCLSKGVKLADSGSRQLIEARVLELLELLESTTR